MLKKYWKKVLSLVLVCTLLIQIVPLAVRADENLPTDLECESQTGLAALYEYMPFEAGRAGTVYLNTYLGTLHLSRTDLSLDGERMPVAISFYFDPVNETASNPYGAGWSTSYSQLLSYNQQTQRYAYKNESGTWVYFVNSGSVDESGNEIWIEDSVYGVGEIGIELRLPAEAEVTDYPSVDLIDDDTHYAFDGSGRLTRISSGVNEITISYVAGTAGSIERITDPVGRRFCFTYANGYLSSIHCETSDGTAIPDTTVGYTVTGGKLEAVTYASSDAVAYEYDASGNVIRVANLDLCGYSIAYDSSARVTSMTSKAAMGTEAEAAGIVTTFAYPEERQTVITSDGTQQRYTFDGCGRVTNCELLVEAIEAATYSMNSTQYQCVYGIQMTYGYVTNADGTIINTVVNVEAYDSDGIIDDSEEEPEEEAQPEETEPEETEPDPYSYTKDAYGNILTETYTQGNHHQTTTYTYSEDGNYLTSQTDANGNTVQYQYNLHTGLLESLLDANGNETEYTYNALRELQLARMDVSGLVNGSEMAASYSYAQGRLTDLNYGDFQYHFTYDIWGNVLSVTMNGNPLVSYHYGENAFRGQVGTMTYGNGQAVYYTYNAIGQVVTVGYTGQTDRFTYLYASDGSLVSISDAFSGQTIAYTESGYEIRAFDGTVLYSVADGENSTTTEIVNGTTYQSAQQSSNNGLTSTKTMTDGTGTQMFSASTSYDVFHRLERKIVNIAFVELDQNYNYANDSDGKTGDLVQRYNVKYTADNYQTSLGFQYTYDGNGNITAVTRTERFGDVTAINDPQPPISSYAMLPVGEESVSSAYTTTYAYDEAGQLIEVVDGETGRIYRYTYDNVGNLRTAKTYDVLANGAEMLTDQRSFQYTNGILSGYTNSSGTFVAYQTDSMGNPTQIGSGVTAQTLTWGEGRMLTGYSAARLQANYTYNSDGLRAAKAVTKNGTTTLTRYVWGSDGLAAVITGDQTVVVLYDLEGEAVGFSADGTVYTYVKNLQGDVIRVLDGDGNVAVQYTYDPWGVPTVTGDTALAAINPCSYRGYYYDWETGYYYLQSRYYDPEIGRFINVDDASYIDLSMSILGYNLFSYCENSPVTDSDPSGYLSLRTAGLIIDGILMAISIGIQINGLVATLKLVKLVSKTSVKLTKKKLIAAIKPYIGTVLQAVLGFTTGVVSDLVSYAVDLFFEMSVGYAIAYAIYTFIPASRRILTK